MPIPCEIVGSIPRPLKLQRAFAAYEAKQITFDQLEPEINAACEDTIRRMEDAGQLVITDGEQRISSFATYSIFDTLNGTGLAENLVDDGNGQAVVAPSMLSLLYPLKSEIPGYTREQFLADLCDQCEMDIRKCFQAGAVRVSMDFTEGRLALRNDVRNPWTNESLLDFFLDLNNRVINRFTAVERVHIGVHTCPGGDSTHSLDISYESLLKEMFKLMAYIGVTSTTDPRVETPEEIAQMLVAATKYIPTDQLGATDDCGFSPFYDDKKQRHGDSPDFARDIAFQKIAARVKGARIASERLGF
ncbi:unnamed protein product [Rhizoctonia solani]|uniref:Cobalamin-independent methionine synthase MetE C-terminal/archaeal domain-containing protein n=1 Tax=Rhizoctonia solani TaxID=456999 RepID=A0A8H3CD89_9AGAM|nr:unnamed protein product [Rhizoctonia solani]